MKNKKILLIILASLSLMIFSSSMVFAAESYSYEADAQVLHDLGLYNGSSTETFDPDLGTAVDREAGIVMLLKLFGLDKEAESVTDADAVLAKFSDAASISSWAKNSVAYAVENGLVQGLPDGTFAPNGPLLGKAYCTLILRQLGYTPDYVTAAAELADKGGLTPIQADALNAKSLINDDLVGISYGALSATSKDGDKVIESLVADKVVDETAAVDAGLLEADAINNTDETQTTTTQGTQATTSSGSHHHHSRNNNDNDSAEAPALETLTIQSGSTADCTTVTAAVYSAAESYVYMISQTDFSTPLIGSDPPENSIALTLPQDIEVTAGQHLGIYALDQSGKVIAFTDHTMVESEITISTPEVESFKFAPGIGLYATSITELLYTNAVSFKYLISKSESPIDRPLFGSEPDAAASEWVENADITSVYSGYHIGVYALDRNGRVLAFTDHVLTEDEINAPQK